jgi:hypothetical protein
VSGSTVDARKVEVVARRGDGGHEVVVLHPAGKLNAELLSDWSTPQVMHVRKSILVAEYATACGKCFWSFETGLLGPGNAALAPVPKHTHTLSSRSHHILNDESSHTY